jgi:hypothetical protein
MHAWLVVATGCAVAEVPPVERADITRVLYLNDCKPTGCVVYPGDDDARIDRSRIVERQIYLDPFSHDDAVWGDFVGCVRRMYAPFDLDVTTEKPGDAPHFELMVAGYPQAIGLVHAGGAALAACPNDVRDNALGFVFASAIDADILCWAAAQESGHMFGLDHAIVPLDPMTWIAPPATKPGFQDIDADCGEASARPCHCNLTKQNSFATLTAILGGAQRRL